VVTRVLEDRVKQVTVGHPELSYLGPAGNGKKQMQERGSSGITPWSGGKGHSPQISCST
jgi:hypothetical protein